MKMIRVRANKEVEQRLNELADKTGLTGSEVVRQLIISAELEPVTTFRPIGKLPDAQQRHTQNDAGVRQDLASAVL